MAKRKLQPMTARDKARWLEWARLHDERTSAPIERRRAAVPFRLCPDTAREQVVKTVLLCEEIFGAAAKIDYKLYKRR